MTRSFLWTVLVMSVVVGSVFSAEEKTHTREYFLGRYGTLVFGLPKDWKDESKNPKGDVPPTLKITRSKPQRAEALVTPVWSSSGAQPPTDLEVRALVKAQGERLLQDSVEKELVLLELNTSDVHGYYYTLSDRNPKRGGYPFVTQGMVSVGGLVMSFGVLTMTPDAAEIREVVEIVGGARLRPGLFYAYRCGLLDFKLKVVLAMAAGFRVQTVMDTESKYEVVLNDVRIVAEPIQRGLNISATSTNLERADKLLHDLMTGVEQIR